MKFSDIDKAMRVYETAHDHCVMPGIYIVARLDGRSFTRLTKERHDLEAPFDVRIRDCMIATVEHLMQCGFAVTYGYTESDEISLLFSLDENTFNRKERKIVSVLAGEASAAFTASFGYHAVFDCRVCQLPNLNVVTDYFRWRAEDAARNSLSAHCYWALRRAGASARVATSALEGLGTAAKNELLFKHGINFNDLPEWQKRGIGFVWEIVDRPTVDLYSAAESRGNVIMVKRPVLRTDLVLPTREEYVGYLLRTIHDAEKVEASE